MNRREYFIMLMHRGQPVVVLTNDGDEVKGNVTEVTLASVEIRSVDSTVHRVALDEIKDYFV